MMADAAAAAGDIDKERRRRCGRCSVVYSRMIPLKQTGSSRKRMKARNWESSGEEWTFGDDVAKITPFDKIFCSRAIGHFGRCGEGENRGWLDVIQIRVEDSTTFLGIGPGPAWIRVWLLESWRRFSFWFWGETYVLCFYLSKLTLLSLKHWVRVFSTQQVPKHEMKVRGLWSGNGHAQVYKPFSWRGFFCSYQMV